MMSRCMSTIGPDLFVPQTIVLVNASQSDNTKMQYSLFVLSIYMLFYMVVVQE